MTEQQKKLDEIVISWDRIMSVFDIVRDNYFGNTEANLKYLQLRYNDCINAIDLIFDELNQQKSNLDALSEEFYESVGKNIEV